MPRVETNFRFQQGICFEIHRNTHQKEDQWRNLNAGEILDTRFRQWESNLNMTAVMKKGTPTNMRDEKNPHLTI